MEQSPGHRVSSTENWSIIRSRFKAYCGGCRTPLREDSRIQWNKQTKAIRCLNCMPDPSLPPINTLSVAQVLKRLSRPMPAPQQEYKRYTPPTT